MSELFDPETGAPISLEHALLAFQAEVPALKKVADNDYFSSKYVPLDSIIETIQPLLTKHGLTWQTFPSHIDGNAALVYKLKHVASGGECGGTMPLLLDKKNSQGLGSALTYARRYALTAVLNLVADEDDDGNQASTPAPPAQQPTQHKDDQRPAAPRIPVDRAQTILQAALACKMATLDLEAAPGTPPTFHPAFKAKLALENVAKIGELNVDSAESVEVFLAQELEGQGV